MVSGFQRKGGSPHLRALSLLLNKRIYFSLLPPANEVAVKQCFHSCVSVILFRWLLKHVRSGSGQYASYLNDFLFSNESYNPCFCVNYDTIKGIMAQSKRPEFYASSFKYQLIWQLPKYKLHGKSRLKFLASSFM